MTHGTALIRPHLAFTEILATIDRGFPSMAQPHLQNPWGYRLPFIGVSRAGLLSRTFRVHGDIGYHL